MKLLSIINILLFITVLSNPNSVDKNKINKEKPSKEVSYIKFYKKRNKDGKYSFFMDNTKRIEGEYVNKKKENLWKFYDLSGNLIIEGFYKENRREGEWLYYKNSHLITKAIYKNDLLNGITYGFYENGDTACIKSYHRGRLDGIYKTFHKDKSIESSGVYANGIKTGNWIYNEKVEDNKEQKTETGKNNQTEYKINSAGEMKDNNIIEQHFFEEDKDSSTDEVYFVVDMMPENSFFMQKYLQKIMYYPVEAKKKRIVGRVFVSFIVNRFGLVEEVKIEKGVHDILDQAAVSTIKELPPWEPGYKNNTPVKVKYTFPLTYTF